MEGTVSPQWRLAPIEIKGNPVEFGLEKTKKVDSQKSPLQLIEGFMKNRRVLVLEAATGSGKTTRLPLGLLRGLGAGKKVVATQPRVLNVTENVDKISGIIVKRGYFGGSTSIVGFMTGAASEISPENRLIFYTEGVLIRRILSDPEETLKDVEYLVLDEVHERTLDLDLLLNIMKELLGKFKDLKVIVTSATLDTEKFAKYLGEPGNIASVGGVEPNLAEPEFLPENVDDYIKVAAERIENIQRYNLETGQWRDILVFLPTKAAVRELYNILSSKIVGDEADAMAKLFITELYRGVSREQKDMAINRLSQLDVRTLAGVVPNRRVIISTNVAETGINFEELKYVIDSGWTNRAYFNPNNSSTSLLMGPISGDTAKQRWGRAGRERFDDDPVKQEAAKGVIYCLYTEEFYEDKIKEAVSIPQVFLQNLNGFVLDLLTFKMKGDNTSYYDLSKSEFLDSPSPEAVSRAIDTLYHIHCLDINSQLTKLGPLIAKLKTNPVHGKMIIASTVYRCVTPIVTIVAMQYVGTENLFNVPKLQAGSLGYMLINEHFSDHYNLWLLYEEWSRHRFDLHWCRNNGLICKGFERVNQEIQDLLASLMDNRVPIFDMDTSDVNKVAKVIKKCVVAGLYYNQAKKDDNVPILYNNERFPGLSGKVARSFAFRNDNRNLTKMYPDHIVYDTLSMTRAASGDIEYKYNMVTAVTDLTLSDVPSKKNTDY